MPCENICISAVMKWHLPFTSCSLHCTSQSIKRVVHAAEQEASDGERRERCNWGDGAGLPVIRPEITITFITLMASPCNGAENTEHRADPCVSVASAVIYFNMHVWAATAACACVQRVNYSFLNIAALPRDNAAMRHAQGASIKSARDAMLMCTKQIKNERIRKNCKFLLSSLVARNVQEQRAIDCSSLPRMFCVLCARYARERDGGGGEWKIE
jgi:hypothetical protein